MAATDVSLLAAGSEAAPVTYTIPATQEFQPKACSASFDGTGASGTFTPALVIRSDAGIVVARCVDTSQTTAAGGSVDASWFPHVAAGAAAASAALPAAYMSCFTPATIANGVTDHPVVWDNYDTSDASVFSWNGLGNVTCLSAGYYFWTVNLNADLDWPTTTTQPVTTFGFITGQQDPFISVQTFAMHPALDWQSSTVLFSQGAAFAYGSSMTAANGVFQQRVSNYTGGNFTYDSALATLWRMSDFKDIP